MHAIRFDDALPLFVKILIENIGEDTVSQGVILRDIVGRLAFFSSSIIEDNLVAQTVESLNRLGPYLRTDRPFANKDEFGVDSVLAEPTLSVTTAGITIRLLDRRLVGIDWLREPVRLAPPPPRFVFASLKGGVGRTTALSVVAAFLAYQGKRVLAVDMDMEAPGLGSVLLDDDTTPEFGLIDALVELKLKDLDDLFMADLVGPSSLADRNGKIDVIPAFGRRSKENPGDVLAKISRAYAEQIRSDGVVATILDQVRLVIDYFSASGKYDVILIDARAGLHETTASAILGLGAHVFLFGLNEKQTFQGYAPLLSHLSRVQSKDEPVAEWLDWITMVQGKAADDSESFTNFKENCQSLFSKSGLISEQKILENRVEFPAGTFSNVPWDDDISDEEVEKEVERRGIEACYVLEDERFKLFDPNLHRHLLSHATYGKAYGSLIKRIAAALLLDSDGGQK